MNGIKLNEQETKELVKNVSRVELFDEISSTKDIVVKAPYPRYLKAVRVTLISLGFDEKWVDTDFRDALEAQYLEE